MIEINNYIEYLLDKYDLSEKDIIPLEMIVRIARFAKKWFAAHPLSDRFSRSKNVDQIKYKIVKSGSQLGCSGSIDEQKAREYCNQLNENNEGVRFCAERIDSFLSGGTCSAMSFDFANRYLEKRTKMESEEAIEAIGTHYETSSEIFRTRQAAFNTISQDPNQFVSDFKKAKIASMLRLHGRNVVAASEECDLSDWKQSLDKIKNALNTFQQGVFVIRCLRPAQNHKKEAFGHSMVLIRENDHRYFYNPGEGIYELDQEYEPETLHYLLSCVNDDWGLPSARMYEIV